jgi:hypothetical protein
MLLRVVVAALAAVSAAEHSCEGVCRGLSCATPSECNQAQQLFGCDCAGCFECGRRLADDTNNTTGCKKPCLGALDGCDAFATLGATCADLETDEYLQLAGATCDCTGCLCGAANDGDPHSDDFEPSQDDCAADALAESVGTETAFISALSLKPCANVLLQRDLVLSAPVAISASAHITGAGEKLSAAGTHRLIVLLRRASASLSSLELNGGFDPFAGGCVFVSAGATLTLQDVGFNNCFAGVLGGAVAAWTDSMLIVKRSFFRNCGAGFLGGAVYGYTHSNVQLADGTTISDSNAVAGGGVGVATFAR